MRKILLVCSAVLAFSQIVIAQERFDVKDISFKAKLDGTIQKYVVMLPKGFDESKNYDLVIGLHGHGSDRWQFVRHQHSGLAIRNSAIKYNMIMVCPDYRAKTSWMGPKAEADMLQIIEELKQQYKIDMVFMSEGSMGGSSALTFAAMHPELVAGVISVNGTANHLEYSNFQDAIAESFGGTKKQIPLEYKKRSAEYWPEKFTMPVGIAASGMDDIVPPQSVLRLADVLEKMGKDIKLVYTPDEGHSTPVEITEELFDYVINKARDRKKSCCDTD
jgi:dipeptidyl aminopeptidase/acylaminoacyl peptidase